MKSLEQYKEDNAAIVKRAAAERRRTARVIVREFLGDMFGTEVNMSTPSTRRLIAAIDRAMAGERR